MIFVRGMIAFALLLCLLPGSILAGGVVLQKFKSKGYDPTQMEQNGESICQASSSDLALLRTRNEKDAITASLKREILIYTAVGFAKSYADQRNRELLSKILSGRGPVLGCGEQWSDDCVGMATLFRELSKLGPDDDWCSAFVTTLAKMVDEQSGGGPANLLHGKGGTDASDYASAVKLLAIFDPKVKLEDIKWTGAIPRKRTDAFLPANMEPVPGCVAIYKDLVSPNKGHITLVIGVSSTGKGGGKISTVEGNSSPAAGSGDRGVFAKFQERPWGADQRYVNSADGHLMAYQGCVMPWPGDSVVLSHNVCNRGTADARLKPVDPGDFTSEGSLFPVSFPVIKKESGTAR